MQRPASIAIVIPVYNGVKHLEACLRSALLQNGVDFEVWIGDDGSTDGSQQIIERFRGSRVHIVATKSNRGLFANLNQLIRATKSPFVHILCQDDILERDCLALELRRFSRFPRVGLIFSKSSSIDDGGQELGRGALHDIPNTLRPELALQHFFYHGCIPSNLSTVALRRTAFLGTGGFDERYKVSGDFDLWTRLCRTWDMGVIHAHQVRVRSHARQLSAADSSGPQFVSENRLIRQEIVPNLPLSVQSAADEFERRRYGVLDVHYALRSLLKGRYGNVRRVIDTMGLKSFLAGAVTWLVTANNRLSRPAAQFVLPSDYRVGP
ncbi:MAG: glycosyltransferase [Deltaproteobacteria bacterium]|nr:glycosyltransferase [Deltaproteobacteria bacterium]